MELRPAVVAVTIMLCLALPRAALSQPAPPSLAETPAPAPAPHHVNLTDLLSLAGPYATFLAYLTHTGAIDTFQRLANSTDHDQGGGGGVTLFAPTDAAFAAVDAAALSGLTEDQRRTLVLCHALPGFRPLSSFAALAAAGPVPTFGAGCAVNVTDDAGRIRVALGWAAARLVSSVYSTWPAAVYALDAVLLPRQVFPTQPAVAAPAPAPAPEPAAAEDNAAGHGHGHGESSSCRVGAGRVRVAYLAVAVLGLLML